MRFLVRASMSTAKFNEAVRDGSAGAKTQAILEDIDPEAAYFTEIYGKRTAVLIVDMEDASRIPSIAEPFFLHFDAEVSFHPVMSPEDLGRSGLDELGEKWA